MHALTNIEFRSSGNRAVKRTHPGTFSVTPIRKDFNARRRPLFYLQRLRLINQVFKSVQRFATPCGKPFFSARSCQRMLNGLWLAMVIVRFPDEKTHKKALGILMTQFSGHSWATGEVLMPEEALPELAREGLTFTVEGPANDERIRSLRNTLATAV